MGTRLISIKIDDETLGLVDELVRLGLFSSRSEAIRALIRAGVAVLEPGIRIARGVHKLFELERDTGAPAFQLPGGVMHLPGC